MIKSKFYINLARDQTFPDVNNVNQTSQYRSEAISHNTQSYMNNIPSARKNLHCAKCQINLLFAVENINSNQVDFGMTVLASLRGGHLNNLAGATFEHDETVLAQSRTLHGEGGRSPGIPGLEVCVLNVTHFVVLEY